jgi:hypothetical protein
MAGRTVWCLSEEAGRRMPTPGPLWELIRRFEPDDRLPGSGVGPDDIIVLDDVRARPAAAAAREEGGHVVWLTALARGDVEAGRVWDLVRRRAAPADAFLLSERQRRGRRDVERVALMMPVARTVAVAEIDLTHRSAWLPLLAGIVHDDRHEMVGGTRHARPLVAAR